MRARAAPVRPPLPCLVDSAPSVNAGSACRLPVQRPPGAHHFARAPPCDTISGVFRIFAGCFSGRIAQEHRHASGRKSLPPFRVRFCGGAPSSKAPRVGEPAGQSGAVFRSTREVPPKPNRKRGYARWMPSRRPQSAEAGPSSKPGILRTAPVAHLARGADGIVHAEAPQTQYPRLEDGFEVTPRVEPETASSLPAGPFAQETLILGVPPQNRLLNGGTVSRGHLSAGTCRRRDRKNGAPQDCAPQRAVCRQVVARARSRTEAGPAGR